MPNLSVIIPSKNADNLVPCMEVVWKNEYAELPIVVVDDGLQPNDSQREAFRRFDRAKNPKWISGVKPFVFSCNVNKGIRHTDTDDIIILGDDGLLQTPGGFSLLQRTAEEHPEFGVIASACNNVGNPAQLRRGNELREGSMVCFIAVLIPRRTIDLVGLLDERFVHYGWEDNDYCRRVRNAGLKIGIHDGCYVDHGSLRSTFRGLPGAGGNIGPNRQIYIEKWGDAA